MSEQVQVHAPHEFSESDGESTGRNERILELVATLLLAAATLGIAWSGYQGARWNGKQAEEYSESNSARAHANRAATAGSRSRPTETRSSLTCTSGGSGPSSSLRSRCGSRATR